MVGARQGSLCWTAGRFRFTCVCVRQPCGTQGASRGQDGPGETLNYKTFSPQNEDWAEALLRRLARREPYHKILVFFSFCAPVLAAAAVRVCLNLDP